MVQFPKKKKEKILQYFKVQFVFIYKNFKKKFFQKVYKQVLQNGLIALYMCVCLYPICNTMSYKVFKISFQLLKKQP